MNMQDFDPERERFISLYATKLKELRRTPFAQRDIRELERLADRCLTAVQEATRGNRGSLERFIQQTALYRGKEGFKSWHVLLSLDAFRDIAKVVNLGRCEEFVKIDDVLHWAVTRYAELYEELQTEQGLVRMVESLTLALDAKEKYTSSHSQSVQKIAEKIGRALGVDVGMAGLFHDIGKIHVPDTILTKTSKLTNEEYQLIKQHPYHSFRIISPISPESASICLRHHERPDGRGYPMGDPNVPVEANVVSAADTLHAICSDRSYHQHQRLDHGVQEITKGKGTQFLPEVVEAVERAYGDMAGLLSNLEDDHGHGPEVSPLT
jgi:HD-GYP domain-containing protein (c-di-GMP phosphodiesterase class II)